MSLKIESIHFHDLSETADVELLLKGGRLERFPLGTQAVGVLKCVIRDREEGFVFINPATSKRYISINRTFDRAIRKLKLTVNNTKLRFHDLRHVFCTWLLRKGVSIDAIRELAGHKDRSTTDRYAALNRMELRNYLSLLPEIKSPNHQKNKAIKNGKNWQGKVQKRILSVL